MLGFAFKGMQGLQVPPLQKVAHPRMLLAQSVFQGWLVMLHV